MEQASPDQWWDIIVSILSIPATIFGIISSFYIIQKATLEKKKLGLETRKLELEVMEKEKKLRSKDNLSKKSVSNNKLKSALNKVELDIQIIENKITNFLMKLMRPFISYKQQKPSVGINSQRVFGSLIELFFFCLFIYVDAIWVADTLSFLDQTLFPPSVIKLVIPPVITLVGTIMGLGLIMGDLLGFTNFTSWADLREKRKPYLAIVLATLIISVVFSALLGIQRLNLIQNIPSSILDVTRVAESFIMTPVIITASLTAEGGIKGILILLALPFFLLRISVTILRKIVARFAYYVSD